MMGWGGGWPWLFGFHGVLWLLLLLVIVLAAVALIRDWRRDRAEDAALRTLGKRYASGEIGRDEYIEMKKDLK